VVGVVGGFRWGVRVAVRSSSCGNVGYEGKMSCCCQGFAAFLYLRFLLVGGCLDVLGDVNSC